MIKLIFLFAAIGLFGGMVPASAQTSTRPQWQCGTNSGGGPIYCDISKSSPVPSSLFPPPFTSQQNLSCTSSSTSINFSTWPAPLGVVQVWPNNSGQGSIYVCTFGGTCSSSVGIQLLPGQPLTFINSTATKPTCITDGTASVVIIGRE